MSKNVYVGIDYSSTSTGVTVLDSSGNFIGSYLLQPKGSFDERIVQMLALIEEALKGFKVIKIGIESPSFFSKGKVVDLSAGYGYIKYSFLANGIDIISKTPSTIKKFATGNGRAGKEDMIEALPKEIKEIFLKINKKKIDDLADSYWLAKLVYNLKQ